MANVIRVQAVVQSTTNIARDRIVNVWHFLCTSAGATELAEVGNVLNLYYTEFSGLWSNTVASSGHELRFYDLADAEPRTPVRTEELALGTIGSQSLPREVALCLSFRGVYESGVNPQRRRGRVYMGPFTASAANASDGRPATALFNAQVTAGDELLAASTSSDDWKWVVYSPTEAATVGNIAACHQVAAGWVDNEWDTVRARGGRATSRTTF